MESSIKIFEHEQFGSIRVIGDENNPWFVASDIASALGYKNPRKAIADHVENIDKNTVTIRDGIGNPNKITINESGVYSLILGSKMERAKKFKHWVTSEVLPSIRKSGYYGNGQIEIVFKAILDTQKQMVGTMQYIATNMDRMANAYDKLSERVEMIASQPISNKGRRNIQADKFTSTQLCERLGFVNAKALNDALVARGVIVRNNRGVELAPQYSNEQLGNVLPFLWHGKQTGTFILWNVKGVDFLTALFKVTK